MDVDRVEHGLKRRVRTEIDNVPSFGRERGRRKQRRKKVWIARGRPPDRHGLRLPGLQPHFQLRHGLNTDVCCPMFDADAGRVLLPDLTQALHRGSNRTVRDIRHGLALQL